MRILRRGGRLPPPADRGRGDFDSNSEGCWWKGAVRDTDVFPHKFGARTVKINIRFDDLWADVRRAYPEVAAIVGGDRLVLEGMYNDEACGWLLYLCGAFSTLGPAAFALVRVFGKDASFLKELNTVAKSVGAQAKRWGTCVCELGTLAGRGVGALDASSDVRTRVDPDAFMQEKAAVCDRALLTRCIEQVVRDEMGVRPTWSPVEDYWTRRWMYTRPGAHSRYAEETWLGDRVNLPPRPTRREFAEQVNDNLVALGEPRVDAGFSEKEEHGKTRAIYGCDTRSYYTFDYLLRPVEAVWRSRRTMLDPGRKLQSTLYPDLAKRPGIRYMLDFDDFNSQHELWAMKEVVRIACAGAPAEVLRWALDSWDNMFVHHYEAGTITEKKMVGTLPSGHRATTFVNTILNRAYCLYAAGGDMKNLDSYHCGDDVIIFGPEPDVSDYIIQVDRSPFRINAAKQSVGFGVGEFLRVSFTDSEACGYPARAVASMVSGNWVTDNRLDKKSYIETLLRGVWTINSRFHTRGIGRALETSLKRRAPELCGMATYLLEHRWSFGGSPVSIAETGDGVVVVRCTGGEAKYNRERLEHTYATDDFMRHHIDYTMLEATDYTPGQLRNMLVRASVKPRGTFEETPLSYITERTNRWYAADLKSVCALISREDRTTVEALNILQSMLTKVEWEKLAGVVRNVKASGYSMTGKSPWPVIAPYTIPFSDAMALRRKLTCAAAVSVNYPVRV
jgi:hypothetical protein